MGQRGHGEDRKTSRHTRTCSWLTKQTAGLSCRAGQVGRIAGQKCSQVHVLACIANAKEALRFRAHDNWEERRVGGVAKGKIRIFPGWRA